MRIIGIGDNVADCYLHQQKFYPGGNAVNVAVNCHRFGMEEAAYLGIFGDDDKAEHIRSVLRKEGIDISRCRKFYGISGQPTITISPEGDRLFSKKRFYTCQNVVALRFIKPDLEYISTFDLCHTSC
ncbi:MAG: carbohydrate kinase, partial [Christensenellaceae bacterium]|nr:carbohydrate kinase [Christensenellaceae bacterium]